MDTKQDKRAIGGNRVVAQFSIKLSALDIADGRFNGTLVFNARGGMFFLGYGLQSDIQAKIFRGSDITSIFELELSHGGKRVALLNNLSIKLMREKRIGDDYGFIVKFVQVTEENLDKLNTLITELPVIESDDVLFSDESDDAEENTAGLEVWAFTK